MITLSFYLPTDPQHLSIFIRPIKDNWNAIGQAVGQDSETKSTEHCPKYKQGTSITRQITPVRSLAMSTPACQTGPTMSSPAIWVALWTSPHVYAYSEQASTSTCTPHASYTRRGVHVHSLVVAREQADNSPPTLNLSISKNVLLVGQFYFKNTIFGAGNSPLWGNLRAIETWSPITSSAGNLELFVDKLKLLAPASLTHDAVAWVPCRRGLLSTLKPSRRAWAASARYAFDVRWLWELLLDLAHQSLLPSRTFTRIIVVLPVRDWRTDKTDARIEYNGRVISRRCVSQCFVR